MSIIATMLKNALYITYDGLTDTLGQSQILPYVIGLSKKGIHFTILSAEKKVRLDQFGGRIQAICKEAGIDWQYIVYSKNPPIVSSVYDVRKMKVRALKLHYQKTFNITHSRSYMACLVSLYLKKKLGVKFIFDMRGFFADERVDGGSWDLNKWHYKKVYDFFKKKEKNYLEQASAVVSLTHKGKQIMQQEWGVKAPIFVIPCATDINLFKRQDIAKHQGLRVGYLGSLGTWYMLPEMLQLYKTIWEKYPDSKLIILTPDNPQLVEVEAKKQHIPAGHVEVSFAKRDELPAILSTFDIGMFFIKASFSKQASSPVKQGEFMSVGIPVITNSGVGDTDTIINKYQSGVLVEEFTEEGYKKAVRQIDDMLLWDKDKIRAGALDYFSLDLGIESYYKIYQKVCAK